MTHRTRLRMDEQDQCGICLVAFEDGEQLKVLECSQAQKHAFHEECII